MWWLVMLIPSARLTVVEAPPQEAPGVASMLYLNRCRGGCTVTKGSDDAGAHRSSLPVGDGPFVLDEFDWSDADWNALVRCVHEVYSPYNITITDVPPLANVDYNEVIVAGTPQQIGEQGIAGTAILAEDCSPYRNVLSFVFANAAATHDVTWLCYAVAQETGHSLGLDHAYEFGAGSSACLDPMSYRTECGGQRFFRPWPARCGEYAPRACRCSPTQNTHAHLLDVLGPGAPITAPPELAILAPKANTQMKEQVTLFAKAQRGVFRFELWLNGYLWAIHPGAPYGPFGQVETAYLVLPEGVPDGVLDIVVVAKDDLGTATTAAVTATRGEPCTTADTCLRGQRCEAGRCFWDPPVGEIGDACAYAQYCHSGLCVDSVCSTTCSGGLAGEPEDDVTCPDNFTCVWGYPSYVCRPGDAASYGGGCSSSSGAGWLALLLLVIPRRPSSAGARPSRGGSPHRAAADPGTRDRART